jgi:hypothetical protein
MRAISFPRETPGGVATGTDTLVAPLRRIPPGYNHPWNRGCGDYRRRPERTSRERGPSPLRHRDPCVATACTTADAVQPGRRIRAGARLLVVLCERSASRRPIRRRKTALRIHGGRTPPHSRGRASGQLGTAAGSLFPRNPGIIRSDRGHDGVLATGAWREHGAHPSRWGRGEARAHLGDRGGGRGGRADARAPRDRPPSRRGTPRRHGGHAR